MTDFRVHFTSRLTPKTKEFLLSNNINTDLTDREGGTGAGPARTVTEGFSEPMCFVITKWEKYSVTTQSLWLLKITRYRRFGWGFTNLFQI